MQDVGELRNYDFKKNEYRRKHERTPKNVIHIGIIFSGTTCDHDNQTENIQAILEFTI